MTDLAERIKKAARVYVIGNGGSYANAAHMANDLLACGIKASTLDAATLTASANDYGYETVFSSWLHIMGEPDDLLIALSGSGKSPNILRAIEVAERIGMDVYRLFGSERGQDMQSAEEHQLRVTHELLRALRK